MDNALKGPKGILKKKSHLQEAFSENEAPIRGPIASATTKTTLMKFKYEPRWRS